MHRSGGIRTPVARCCCRKAPDYVYIDRGCLVRQNYNVEIECCQFSAELFAGSPLLIDVTQLIVGGLAKITDDRHPKSTHPFPLVLEHLWREVL